MSMKITGVEEAKKQFAEIEAFLASEKPMKGIIEDIKERIQQKTGQGHDYMGRNFEPYSAAYKKCRRKKGLSTKPDLRVTGTMIDAIKTRIINPRHGQIFVPAVSDGGISADMLAQIHNTGTGKQPQREFMNISPSAVKALTKKHYDDPIGDLAKRARGR